MMDAAQITAARTAAVRRKFLFAFTSLTLLGVLWLATQEIYLTSTSDPLVNAPVLIFMFYVAVPLFLPVCTLVAAVQFHETLAGNVVYLTMLIFFGFVPTVLFAHHFITTM